MMGFDFSQIKSRHWDSYEMWVIGIANICPWWLFKPIFCTFLPFTELGRRFLGYEERNWPNQVD